MLTGPGRHCRVKAPSAAVCTPGSPLMRMLGRPCFVSAAMMRPLTGRSFSAVSIASAVWPEATAALPDWVP